jgi:hypothetical protein
MLQILSVCKGSVDNEPVPKMARTDVTQKASTALIMQGSCNSVPRIPHRNASMR